MNQKPQDNYKWMTNKKCPVDNPHLQIHTSINGIAQNNNNNNIWTNLNVYLIYIKKKLSQNLKYYGQNIREMLQNKQTGCPCHWSFSSGLSFSMDLFHSPSSLHYPSYHFSFAKLLRFKNTFHYPFQTQALAFLCTYIF